MTKYFTGKITDKLIALSEVLLYESGGDFFGRDAEESYVGEASVYKAQLCAQLNDPHLR